MNERAKSTAGTTISHIRFKLTGQGVGAILVRGATGAAGAHATGAALAFLAQLVLARLLGVTQYGYYAYAFAWVTILAQLGRLGFHDSLIRFTVTYRTQGKYADLRGVAQRGSELVFLASVICAILLGTCVLLMRHQMAAEQLRTFLIAAGLLVPLTMLGVTQGLLKGYRQTARAELPFRAFFHGGTLALALIVAVTFGLEHASVAMGLSLVAGWVSLAFACHWVVRVMRKDILDVVPVHHTAFWLRTSLPMLLMAGMQIVMKQTDTLMLGAISGTNAAGVYYPVSRMSELAAFGLMSANAIVAPLISELHANGERERLQRLLTLAAIGTSTVTLFAVMGFWLLGNWLLGWFGSAFTAGYPALMTLLVGQIVNALCGPVGFLMTMTGHQNRASLVLSGGALVNVVLNTVLIPSYGITGAAVATTISVVFWNIWMLVEVVRRHGLNPSVCARWPKFYFLPRLR